MSSCWLFHFIFEFVCVIAHPCVRATTSICGTNAIGDMRGVASAQAIDADAAPNYAKKCRALPLFFVANAVWVSTIFSPLSSFSLFRKVRFCAAGVQG